MGGREGGKEMLREGLILVVLVEGGPRGREGEGGREGGRAGKPYLSAEVRLLVLEVQKGAALREEDEGTQALLEQRRILPDEGVEEDAGRRRGSREEG